MVHIERIDTKQAGTSPIVSRTLPKIDEDESVATIAEDGNLLAAEYELISNSEYFDRNYYIRRYPDIMTSEEDPIIHYLKVGAAEGRNPSAAFCCQRYLIIHRGVARLGLNPLIHYLRYGVPNGISSPHVFGADAKSEEAQLAADRLLLAESDLFDTDYYLAQYPDVCASQQDPIIHYMKWGAAEGRNPSAGFCSEQYLTKYHEVAEAGMNPLVHYLLQGKQKGYQASAAEACDNDSVLSDRKLLADSKYFDEEYYKDRNPEVKETGEDPITHYLRWGAAAGRNPSAAFCSRRYLIIHSSAAESGMNPLVHFLRYGAEDLGQAPEVLENDPEAEDAAMAADRKLLASSSYFDPEYYLLLYPDVRATGEDPIIHYLKWGAAEGRDPSGAFCSRRYLSMYRTVAAAGMNPLVHYLRHGVEAKLVVPPVQSEDATEAMDTISINRELLANSDLFDSHYYLEMYPDVGENREDPIAHYLTKGAAQGRNPSAAFCSQLYLSMYRSVADAGMNPLVHYLRHGLEQELLVPPVPAKVEVGDDDVTMLADRMLIAASKYFNAEYYLDNYPDVRLTGENPISHYLKWGAAEGRNPSAEFSTQRYLSMYQSVADAGLNPLVHYLRHGVGSGLSVPKVVDGGDERLVENVLRRHESLQNVPRQLPIYHSGATIRRVNMVTDSINAGSLFGGVGTAVIFTILLAREMGCAVRVILLKEAPVRRNILDLLTLHGIEWAGDVDFVHANVIDATNRVAVTDGDVFVTTSWWSTQITRQTVDPARIVYLLQEDERMFYPLGDERLRCDEVMNDPRITKVVNSKFLLDHLMANGLADSSRPLISFEPSFPKTLYSPGDGEIGARKQLFFYARPNHPRNLFYRGIEALDQALLKGVLSSETYDINLVGSDIPEIRFSGNVRPVIHKNLPWESYAKLIQRMDIGLSLMYTPHPSYPPLDLAASGAVVVTNRFGNKQTLGQYCGNIITVGADTSALVEGLREAVILAADKRQRRKNYRNMQLGRDWRITMREALATTARGFAHVC